MRIHLFILISFCTLLTSCGQWKWVGSHKPTHPLEQDIIHCKNYAHKEFPPKTYYQKISHYDASATNDGARGITIRPYEQIDIQLQDANLEARDHAFKQCMREKGWQLEY